MPVTCKVCLASNSGELEAAGLRALKGELSWRAAARDAGFSNYQSLKNHMESHFVVAQERAVEDDMERLIEEAVRELRGQFAVAPPEVKPLILTAIHNVRELRLTKPSQQNLISALKTIQEMTGMKQEQRLMLAFAERMFGEVAAPAESKQLEAANVIDVEGVEVPPRACLDESAYASTSERG